MSDRREVYDAISRERDYQDARRGYPHGVGAWLIVLQAELIEAQQAWVKGHPDDRAALAEVLQVAAVAVACLEQHGVCERAQIGD